MEYSRVNRWLSSFDLKCSNSDLKKDTEIFIKRRLHSEQRSVLNIIHCTTYRDINKCKTINRNFRR